ncbi:MAG: site-specific DNA-methyltransferase [Chlorobi bacterium]|nr:site-specific DNA-methyltransferase [Chlorobiota bacterium]MCI0716936.1 site-specific DNA-methyltransferase [Chlorobiota bacterium]
MKKSHQLKTHSIYCGDCLKMLDEIPDESIDLIYIDPPFNSNRNYETFWGDVQEKRAFTDRFGDAEAYINYMRPRVLQLYRVLKKTGSFYYHCDWHASHYVKIMLDEIFNFNNFQNEIIWKRKTGRGETQHKSYEFGVCTESIFFYTKGEKYTFNSQYSFDAQGYDDYVKRFFKHVDENGRVFRIDNIASPSPNNREIELEKTELEKEYVRTLKPVIKFRGGEKPLIGDAVEHMFADLVSKRILDKAKILSKYQKADSYELLIYYDGIITGLLSDDNINLAIYLLKEKLLESKINLDKISIIISKFLLYNCLKDSKIFILYEY